MSMTPSSSAAAETERRLGVLRGEILSAITQACQAVPFLVLDEIDPVLEACRPCIFKVVDIEHAAVAARARGMTQCYSNYTLTDEDIAALRPGAVVETSQEFVSHADKIRAGVFSPDDPKPPSMFAKDATATEIYEVKP